MRMMCAGRGVAHPLSSGCFPPLDATNREGVYANTLASLSRAVSGGPVGSKASSSTGNPIISSRCDGGDDLEDDELSRAVRARFERLLVRNAPDSP